MVDENETIHLGMRGISVTILPGLVSLERKRNEGAPGALPQATLFVPLELELASCPT